MRYILQPVSTFLPASSRQQPEKLLITKDIPINAYFIELVCKSIYVQAEVLHVGCNGVELKLFGSG